MGRNATNTQVRDPVALLQRDDELAAIDRWLDDLQAGQGRVAVLLASAGLGKTALLTAARVLAERRGVDAFSGRGAELERGIAFGVARQIFETPLRAMPAARRRAVLAAAAAHARPAVGLADDAGGGGEPFAVVHGLYWLAANMAEQTPLLLVADDIHWADPESLQWLAYLAARIADLPILVVAAARPAEGAGQELIEALTGEPAVERVTPAALDAEGAGELVRARLGVAADGAFVAACHKATAGNPFYLQELLRAVVADGIDPLRAKAEQVRELGSDDLARSILVRLARLGAPARALAAAVACLGGDAALHHAAQLGGLSIDDASAAWDVLARAEILAPQRPLEFIHPIARAAVYGQLAPGERGRAHRRAAQMLAAEGAFPDQVGLHALACEPAGDAAVVGWLSTAAQTALGAGAPDAAARYLRRALEEPPTREDRPRVHFELGQALVRSDFTAAAASFAAAASGDAETRLLAHRWRAQTLAFAGRGPEAVATIEEVLPLVGDDAELSLLLGATRDVFAVLCVADPGWAQRSRRLQESAAGLEGATPGERRVLAAASLDAAQTGAAPVARALELANRVRATLATWLDADEGVETPGCIGTSGILCDDPEGLARHARAFDAITRQGRTVHLAAFYAQTSNIRLRLGALLEAEADARTGWELARDGRDGASGFYWWSAAALVDVLAARGAFDDAAHVAEDSGLWTVRREESGLACPPLPLVVRGDLALALARTDEGIARLMDDGPWLEEMGLRNPSLNPWRAKAAAALAVAGRVDEAREIVEPAVRRARDFGAPWALGMALRAAGVVEQGERGLELLREAIAVLEPAGCRLEHAHALLELGALLRRSKHRATAREHLRAALDLAHRIGAVPLADRARDELAATGALPRRALLSGPESLTASERRVARLAAEGRSNPEIAQSLFVTRKTVETHLGHAYAKLGISARAELSAALAEPA